MQTTALISCVNGTVTTGEGGQKSQKFAGVINASPLKMDAIRWAKRRPSQITRLSVDSGKRGCQVAKFDPFSHLSPKGQMLTF